jgi:glutathione synthase/RimK-type ligase-like ATP-grasp enzyme
MRIGIHNKNGSFSEHWITYCDANNINYKCVDCYRSDILQQLSDCDALMWHFHQNSPKGILFSKQLIYSIEAAGIKVFPDFHTVWYFDDKVGQKYLLEAIGAPLAPTWVFYDKYEALQWINQTGFPKVFKLRGGAGSQNVKLIRTKEQAVRLTHRAFGRGFPQYDSSGSLKERWRLYRKGKTTFRDILEGIARFVIPPPYARIKGRDRGYIYFQEYIANNDHDIRVIIIGDKAFAIKRMVRDNDFRASGSRNILYDKHLFNEKTIKLSFNLAEKLQTQCVAFDYVHDNGNPLLLEISYGFSPEGYEPCPGYWDNNLEWHEGKFNPYRWMVENLLKIVSEQGNTTNRQKD